MALDLGSLRIRVTLETPTTVPDSDGGYTETWAALSPSEAWVSIQGANQRSLERLVSNTVIVQATHIVRMRYHPQLDTGCRLRWVDRSGTTRTMNVTDVNDVEEQGVEMVVLVAEVTT